MRPGGRDARTANWRRDFFLKGASNIGAAVRAASASGDGAALRSPLLRPIVSLEEWASSPYYSGNFAACWPSVRNDVLAICSQELDAAGNSLGDRYSEAILAGAIGRAKTTVSAYVATRFLYVLSCYEDPGLALGQEKAEDIMFLFISVDYQKAFEKPFGKFCQVVKSTPYFKDHFWAKDFDTTRSAAGPEVLHFPRGITAKPTVTTEKGVISHTVACAVVDEVEHMNVVSNSALTRGVGTVYDQAEAVITELLNRMKSRMEKAGRKLGKVIFTSSPKYPQSFLQKRLALAKSYAWPHVYASELSLWEAQRGATTIVGGKEEPNFPDEMTPEGGFSVEVGDDQFVSRILDGGDRPREGARIIRVPVTLRDSFDPKKGAVLDEALRDLAGIPRLAVSPLIEDREGLAACIRRVDMTHELGCACDTCSLARHPYLGEESYLESNDELIAEYLCVTEEGRGGEPVQWPRKNRSAPRFVHIDGSFDTSGGDATGFVMLHPMGMRTERERGKDGKEVYVDNVVGHVDLALRIRRDPSKPKLEWSRIRDLLVHLRDDLHFDIVMVSMDKYQSTYFLQELRDQDGFETDDKMSVDDKPLPYLMLRDAIAARRVSMYEHTHLIRELQDLEFNRQRRKVDHPKHSTKDIADALCGAFYKAVTLMPEYAGWDCAPQAGPAMGSGKPAASARAGDNAPAPLPIDSFTADGPSGRDSSPLTFAGGGVDLPFANSFDFTPGGPTGWTPGDL